MDTPSSDEIFSRYRCQNLNGIDVEKLDHPGDVVESASLAAVDLPKTDYQLALPNDVIRQSLSSLQVEGVIYACSKHQEILPSGERAGFCIGDGAGIGKGRQISACILENFLRGRSKHLWISTSNDLYFDACRDMKDLGAHIPVIKSLQDLEERLNKPSQGILFTTYATLASRNNNSLRMRQIVEWLGGDSWDGVLVFDEAHKAKHGSTKKGQGTFVASSVLSLQKSLPKARVLYCSATGISDIRNMAYLSRIQLYGPGTPFATFDDLVAKLANKDMSILEMLAQELKLNGFYVARNFSYAGAEFEDMQVNLSESQIAMYDGAVALLGDIRDGMEEAAALTGSDNAWNRAFWGTVQRFFKILCVSMKVDAVMQEAKQSLEQGYAIVIGLQSTGEAAVESLDLKPGRSYNLVSVTREILLNLVRNHFPFGKDRKLSAAAADMVGEKRDALVENILSANLPGNFLDELIDGLGGPDHVAELTGRRGRLVKESKNSWKYELRASDSEIDSINVRENQLFNDGKKLVAIVSDAASTGISLHASRKVSNQRRRIHYTIELPWSADKAIQQMGRSHRSNQTSAPVYRLVFTNVGGEKRFAAAVAKRLQSLGALTRGDRRASGFNMQSFHYDSPAGKRALRIMFDHILAQAPVLPPGISPSIFDSLKGSKECNIASVHADMKKLIDDMGLEVPRSSRKSGESDVIKKFLNRLLAIPIRDQQLLFSYFEAILNEEMRREMYSEGQISFSRVSRERDPIALWQDGTSGLETIRHDLQIDRGTSWDEALSLLESQSTEIEANGFYQTKRPLRGSSIHPVCLIILNETSKKFGIIRPATGKSTSELFEHEIKSKYASISADSAKERWESSFETSQATCIHGGGCQLGSKCIVGRRLLPTTLLSGSVVRIWDILEAVLHRHERTLTRIERSMRVLRIDSLDDSGQSVVGLRYPRRILPEVIEILESKQISGAPNQGQRSSMMEAVTPVNPGYMKRAFVEPQRSIKSFFGKLNSNGSLSKKARAEISPSTIGKIQEMGFSETQAKRALARSNNSLSQAIEYLIENEFVDLS